MTRLAIGATCGLIVAAIFAQPSWPAVREPAGLQRTCAVRVGSHQESWGVRWISRTHDSAARDAPTSIICFANGRTLETHLYHVSLIASLPSSVPDPFLIVGGAHCLECDADQHSVYIGRLSAWPPMPDGTFKPGDNGAWFSQYPHQSYGDKKMVVGWSRLFIGHCLGPDRFSAVSFNADLGPGTQSWSRTVAWASVDGDQLNIKEAASGADGAPLLSAVADAVGHRVCREVRQETYDQP